MVQAIDILSPFQEFGETGAAGADLDLFCIPEAPFRLLFAGIERDDTGAITTEVSIERVVAAGSYIPFLWDRQTGVTQSSLLIEGPRNTIPRGYGVRVKTSGLASGKLARAKIVIEKLGAY